MAKTVILFQPKFWPGPINNERPARKKYYHGVRETFRYFPLGLLSVATILRDEYDVRVIDARFDEEWRETVAGIIRDTDLLFVGVTACTGHEIKGGLAFSGLVRELAPEVPVVWGGWHASTVPEGTASSPSVDIVVRGQGEWTALELAKRLSSGSRDYSGIKGLTYQLPDGEIVNEPDRKVRPANDMPLIDYSFIDANNYLRFKDESKARLFYVASIGCPFNCSFCSIASVYKRHWTAKDPDKVVRELRYFVDRYGIDTVEFDGTIFFANTKWAKEVLRALIDSGMDLSLITSTRADIIVRWDEEMRELVKQAGFVAIGVGAESGSENVLKLLNKKLSVADVIGSLKVLKDLDIDPAYTFMFGIPGETDADTVESLELMRELKQIMPTSRLAAFFYHPFPGSELQERCEDVFDASDMTLEEWADYSSDLKQSRSLGLRDDYVEFVNERIQYLEWAYPDDDGDRGFLRSVLSRISQARVNLGVYAFPAEWLLAKLLQKSNRLADSQSI